MQLTQFNLEWEPIDQSTYSVRPEYLIGQFSLLKYFPQVSSWLKEKNFSRSSWEEVLATVEMLEQWSSGSLNSMAGKKDGMSYVGYESLRKRFKTNKTFFERKEVYQGDEVVKVSTPIIDHPLTRTFSTDGSYKNFKNVQEVRSYYPLPTAIEALLEHRNALISSVMDNRANKLLSLRRANARVVKLTVPKFVLLPESVGFDSKSKMADYLGLSESSLRKAKWKDRIATIKADKSRADGQIYGIEIDGFVLYSQKERFYVNQPGYCIPINIKNNDEAEPVEESIEEQAIRYSNEEQIITLKVLEKDLQGFLCQLRSQEQGYRLKGPEQKRRSLRDVQELIKGQDVFINIAGALEITDGMYQTDIIYRRSNFGRFYSTHKNNPFNPQLLKREYRKALLKSQYSYDIDACHPRIIISLAARLDIPTPTIRKYVKSKSEYRDQIAKELQTTSQFVKDSFNAAVNGSLLNSIEFKKIREHSLVKSFISEVQAVRGRINDLPEYTEPLKGIKASQKLPFVLQLIESEVMKMVREKYPDMTLLIHDGFYGLTDAQNTIKEVEEACIDQFGAYIKFD